MMAEAVAVIGLVAAIGQLVDFGTKVIKRLDEFQSDIDQVPQTFRDIKNQLPLLLNTLQRTKAQAEAGDIDEDTQKAILSVVEGCRSQVQSLDDTLVKTFPAKGDSKWRHGVKVFRSVSQEKDVQQIVESLQTYVSTLTYHQAAGFPKVLSVRTKPLFTVPFERDPNFIPRSDILEQVDQKLKAHRRVALAGIGGVGQVSSRTRQCYISRPLATPLTECDPNRKSQIAVEFCYRFKEEYPRGWVLWVYASTTTRFDEAYKEIARKACLPGWEDPKVNTLQLVFEWLSGESIDRWLLVLDNADDEDVLFGTKNDLLAERGKGQKPMANYIPRNLNGSVIITTRDQRIGRRLADSGKPIAIMPMAIQEAEQLLQSKTWEDSISKEADSKNLLHDLGNLPLAITQAAAFMNENSMTVSEYLDALRASDRDIKDLLSEELEDLRRDSDTSNSVIRTWKLSFDQIRKQKPRGAEILSLMSVLDRQGIPKSLLQRENERLIEFTTAMGTLQAFSLITAEREGETFEMHRLVQLSTQRWLEAERKIVQWQREALKLLSKVFPEGIFENWAICNRLVPHAQIVVGYSFDTQTCQLHRATILNNLAVYDHTQGRYGTAVDKCTEALAAREKVLGTEHSDTLTSVSNLASVLQYQGKYEEAEGMHRRVLEEREKVLGAEHPFTLISVSNLASVLRNQGKYEEAEGMHRRVLKRNKKIAGAEHPYTLINLSNLASVLRNQGKYEEAEEMHRQALNESEKVLGADHPSTLTSADNLALVLQYQGKYREAEGMYRQVLEKREKVLGAEHPSTLTSLNNLASVIRDQGRYKEAEEMHRQALKESEKVLGAEHPSTLTSVTNLARVLQYQGKYEEAEEMHRRVLKGSEKVLGAEHPYTLINFSNLASVIRDQGKYKKAEQMHRQVLERREKVLGAEHPSTLTSVSNLASVLQDQGRYKEAEKMNRRALNEREKVLGAKHPDTLASVSNLASVLRDLRKYEEAEKLNRRALEGRERVLAMEHPDTLTSVYNLAYLLHNKGQYDAASGLYQRAIAGYQKTLGSHHPTSLACSEHYSSMLDELNERKPGDYGPETR